MTKHEEAQLASAILLFDGTEPEAMAGIVHKLLGDRSWRFGEELQRLMNHHITYSTSADYVRERMGEDYRGKALGFAGTDEDIYAYMRDWLEAPDSMCETMGYVFDEMIDQMTKDGKTYLVWTGECGTTMGVQPTLCYAEGVYQDC